MHIPFAANRRPERFLATWPTPLGDPALGGAVVNGNDCLPGFLFPPGKSRPSGFELLGTLTQDGITVTDFAELEPLDKPASVLAHWIERAGAQLADASLAATAFFASSVIVLGGRLPNWINARLVARTQTAKTLGPSRGLPVAPLRAAKLGLQGGAIGAACLPLFASFFGGHTTTFGSVYLDGRRAMP